ncbi:MAG TPA: spore germination protein [Bacillales bacterium]|nr:spore germination protein [Bacillales bacterium]
MPYFIQFFNMKTNGVNMNGNIDIGPTVQNSHTANTKSIGANFNIGDFTAAASLMANCNVDPDISDQDQNANPSLPIAGDS